MVLIILLLIEVVFKYDFQYMQSSFFHGRVTLSSTCPWPTSGLGREATRKTYNKGHHGVTMVMILMENIILFIITLANSKT